jgi:hypothetical protein
MRHDDRLAAIAARFDHAALVVMADLVADFVAEVHIYSSDTIPKAVQRGTTAFTWSESCSLP